MDTRLNLHVVDRDIRSRGEMVRGAISFGHQAHGYDDLESLIARMPGGGTDRDVVILADMPRGAGGDHPIRMLDAAGLWLPVIVAGRDMPIPSIVDAMRAGAIDVLGLPLDLVRFGAVLQGAMSDGARHVQARRRLADARSRISRLTRREREVLDWLTAGCSNKIIARELAISPRTVEVHRANMMDKLGAGHPADAVRLRLELGPPPSARHNA